MINREEREIPRRRILGVGVGLGIGTVLAACGPEGNKEVPQPTPETPSASIPEHDKNHEVDLLGLQTWKYMPGATKEGSGLRISNTGLAIRTLEDTWENPSQPEYIPNPPQNIYGTHTDMSDPDGNVDFTARLSDIKGKATLSFQSAPTLRYDERVYRHDGIDVEIEDGTVTINMWQEGQKKPHVIKKIKINSVPSAAEISLTQTDTGVMISAGGQTVDISKTKVFTSGEIWFGMNASQSWNLNSFNARTAGNNTLKSVDISKLPFGKLSPRGLQAHVSKKQPGLVVGTAVDTVSLLSDPHLAKLVVEQFSGLSTEMLAKPQALQPEEGHFVWNELDALVDFAQRHDKQIHGHTLIFGEANPKWLEDKLHGASRAEAVQLMRQHIQPVVSRYKDKIRTWDVVNEPYSDEENWGELREHGWMKAIGKTYMEEAFHIAHAADPEALLFMNENALESDDDRWNAMIELVKDMKSRGVPIHGIGFQAHFDEETLADDEVISAVLNGHRFEKRFKELEELGLKVRISEMSVAGEDKELQARIYAAALRACKNAPNCIGFTVWGAASNAAYFTSEPDEDYKLGPAQYGDDAPWQQNPDGTYTAKPAVKMMLAA